MSPTLVSPGESVATSVTTVSADSVSVGEGEVVVSVLIIKTSLVFRAGNHDVLTKANWPRIAQYKNPDSYQRSIVLVTGTRLMHVITEHTKIILIFSLVLNDFLTPSCFVLCTPY